MFLFCTSFLFILSWCNFFGQLYFYTILFLARNPLLSSETTILLISTKNRDLWPVPKPEVCESRTNHQIWQIWLAENTERVLWACSTNWDQPEVSILRADQKDRGLGTRMQETWNKSTFSYFNIPPSRPGGLPLGQANDNYITANTCTDWSHHPLYFKNIPYVRLFQGFRGGGGVTQGNMRREVH